MGRSAKAVAALLLASGFGAQSVSADVWWWDPNEVNGIGGGNGTWTSANDWFNPAASQRATWPSNPGIVAGFPGIDGNDDNSYEVNVSSSVSAAAGMQFGGVFNSSLMSPSLDYDIDGSGTLTLGGTIQNTCFSTTIWTNLAGSGFELNSAQTDAAIASNYSLKLRGNSSSLSGFVTLTRGTLDIGPSQSSSTLGTASVRLNGGFLMAEQGATVSSSITMLNASSGIASRSGSTEYSGAVATPLSSSLLINQNITANTTVKLSGNNSNLQGGILVKKGTLVATNAFSLGSSTDNAKIIELQNESKLQLEASSSGFSVAGRSIRMTEGTTLTNVTGNNTLIKRLQVDSGAEEISINVDGGTLTLNDGWEAANQINGTIVNATVASGSQLNVRQGITHVGPLKLRGMLNVQGTETSFGQWGFDGNSTGTSDNATYLLRDSAQSTQINFEDNGNDVDHTTEESFVMRGKGTSSNNKTTRIKAQRATTVIIGERTQQVPNASSIGGIYVFDASSSGGSDFQFAAVLEGGVYAKMIIDGKLKPTGDATADQGVLFAGAKQAQAKNNARRTKFYFWGGAADTRNSAGKKVRATRSENTMVIQHLPPAIVVPVTPTQAQLELWDAEALDFTDIETVSDDYGYDDPDSPLDTSADDGSGGIYASRHGPFANVLTATTADVRLHTAGYIAVVGNLEGSGTFTKVEAGELRARNINASGLTIDEGIVTIRNTPSSETPIPSRLNSLLLAGGSMPTAKLDLTNNDLIVDYTGTSPSGAIRDLLKAGRNGGAWDANGIAASFANDATDGHDRALGYMESSLTCPHLQVHPL